MAKNIIVLHKK